jgi:hypothetical protein
MRWLHRLAVLFGFREAAARYRGVTNDEARELIRNLFGKLREGAQGVTNNGIEGPAFMSEERRGDSMKRIKGELPLSVTGKRLATACSKEPLSAGLIFFLMGRKSATFHWNAGRMKQ